MTATLTDMQRRYIWLAGSFPHLVVAQGHGYRGGRLRYAIDEDGGRLVLFGYSNPLYFLVGRGLFKQLQAHNTYTLTDKGVAEFRAMLMRGDGGKLNDEIREVRMAANGNRALNRSKRACRQSKSSSGLRK